MLDVDKFVVGILKLLVILDFLSGDTLSSSNWLFDIKFLFLASLFSN